MKSWAALTIIWLIFSSNANAEVPCDFKGVSVGDKLTPAEFMKKLGIKKYVLNPKIPEYAQQRLLIEKHGLISASEIAEWKTGPYCDNDSCRIPSGVMVGDNIPASIFVSMDSESHLIKAIQVSINSLHWDELVGIIKRKYGKTWKLEVEPMLITDYATKESETFQRQSLTHLNGGTNYKTKSSCTLFASKYDLVFTHADPLGTYHSYFEIKLISDNF